MAAPRTIRTATGKELPDPPDFNQNVLRAVETEWLHYALGPNSEKLCARWVTITMAGGKKHVQLQKDDGRGHAKRPNANVGPSGYYMLNALDGKPSMLILTVQDMAEAVYRHYLARGPDEKTQEVFCRRFGNMYEGTRREDMVWILNKIKLRTKEAEQGLLPTYNTMSFSSSHAVQTPRKARVTVDLSSPARASARPVNNISKTSDDTDRYHSLSASRKRVNTASRDFSERESSRRRLAGQETWSDYITAHTSRKISTTEDLNKVAPSNSYSGTGRSTNADLRSPSRSTAKEPQTSSRPVAVSSTKIGKASSRLHAGKSDNPALNSKEPDRPAGEGNVARRTNDISGHNKMIKGDPGMHTGRITDPGPNRGRQGGKQGRRGISEGLGSMSIETSKLRNGSGGFELNESSARGAKARKQSVIAGSSMGSPKKVSQGPDKGSGTARGGSPTKVNKGYGGRPAKPAASPMTPVKSVGYPKSSFEVRNRTGPPGSSLSDDTKKPATPVGPRSDPARFSSYGPGGASARNSYASATSKRMPFRGREPYMGQVEKKSVDSTAHLYKSAPEPEKYSDEWQKSRLELGLASKQKEKTTPIIPPVKKAPAVAPTGLAGVLNVIADWSSGNTGSKSATGANCMPARTVSILTTPSKPSSDFKTPATTVTPSRLSSGDSTPMDRNSSRHKYDLPPKPPASNTASSPNDAPSSGPRNFSGASLSSSSRIGISPPTGPASMSYRGPPRHSPLPPRPSPPSGSDSHGSYKPSYDAPGGPRRDYYHDIVRSGYGPGPGSSYDPRADYRSAPGVDSRPDTCTRAAPPAGPRSGRRSPEFENYRPRSGDQYFDARGGRY